MQNLIELLIFLIPILAVLAIGAFVADYLLPKLFGDDD